MIECVYNYSLQDNLSATKFLFQTKSKRKTNIVTMVLVALTFFGILASIGAIIMHSKGWYIGIISVLLLVAYFLVDRILLNNVLNRQKEFYSTNLSKVSKIKVAIDGETMTETFLAKENVIGTNVYKKLDLTAVKVTKSSIFYVFKDENVVLVKRDCLKEKAEAQFFNFAENILKPAKKSNRPQN